MKLKNMIIDNEYNEAFLWEKEYTDWIACMEYDCSETNIPGKLTVNDKTNIIINNEEYYSPYSTVNS